MSEERKVSFTIRDVSSQAAAILKERAAAAGKSTEGFVRDWIESLAETPLVRQRYTLRAYGSDGARVTIERHSDHPNGVGGGAVNLTQEQLTADRMAREYVRRNQPGDREQAITLLKNVFSEVFEA
jgi:plasmid stability protein